MLMVYSLHDMIWNRFGEFVYLERSEAVENLKMAVPTRATIHAAKWKSKISRPNECSFSPLQDKSMKPLTFNIEYYYH